MPFACFSGCGTGPSFCQSVQCGSQKQTIKESVLDDFSGLGEVHKKLCLVDLEDREVKKGKRRGFEFVRVSPQDVTAEPFSAERQKQLVLKRKKGIFGFLPIYLLSVFGSAANLARLLRRGSEWFRAWEDRNDRTIRAFLKGVDETEAILVKEGKVSSPSLVSARRTAFKSGSGWNILLKQETTRKPFLFVRRN